MAKQTPLQFVKDQYGSKDKLIDAVTELVQPDEGETAEEHKKRLKYVSNAKLLHVLAVAKQAQTLGGRDGMVDAVLKLKGQPKDNEYRDRLKRLSLGRLVDLTQSLQRAAKQAG